MKDETFIRPGWSTVEVDGGELEVARWGSAGPVVVAAHGITSSAIAWTRVAGGLADEAQVLAPDLRGRGRSAGLSGPYGIGAHAEDLVAVLDASGAEQGILLGHSMGGFVAALAAARQPGRWRALVMVDGGAPFADAIPAGVSVDEVLEQTIGPALTRLSGTFPSQEAYRELWRQHPALADVEQELVDAYADHDLVGEAPELHSSCSLEAVRADARSLLDDDEVTSAWRRAEVRTILLHAERGMLDGPDGLYSHERLEGLRGQREDLTLRAVPGVNHYTITMSGHGAGAVVAAVRDVIAADPSAPRADPNH